MDKTAVLGIINQFKIILESKSVSVNKIILFGSYMTGKFKEGSDIDLVIISDDFKSKAYWERIDLLSDAIYEVFKPIEAVALTSDEWEKEESMVVDYARDGEVVYAV
ncbi:MAG: nucleotidyltransferase domain-containing protein [Candidatus Omnitrophota bacterium]